MLYWVMIEFVILTLTFDFFFLQINNQQKYNKINIVK